MLIARRRYEEFQERCNLNAGHAVSEEAKQAWISLAETYGVLLAFETSELLGAQIGVKRQRSIPSTKSG